MTRHTNAKRRSASTVQELKANNFCLPIEEDERSSSGRSSAGSNALTSTTVDRHEGSDVSTPARPMDKAASPALAQRSSLSSRKVATQEAVSIPIRKRARAHTMSRSDSSSSSSGGDGDGHAASRLRQTSPSTRSPSANAITGGAETAPAVRDARPRLSADVNASPLRRQRGSLEEEREVFFEASSPATATATPLRLLQGTPTSQLLSQLQDLPYSAPTEERADEALEEATALFTPVTVARRRVQPALADDAVSDPAYRLATGSAASAARNAAAAIASSSPSGSRSSVHDDAVAAILRANPPTTTRAAELKPGYRIPSPRSPLWAALDADDVTEGRPTRGSTRSEEEEAPWTHTQVSLFQDAEEDGVADGAHAHVPSLTATQLRRHLGTRRSAQDRISLPAPERSVNLLDDEGLHDDERRPLFVGERDRPVAGEAEDESFVFSLTQEAVKQERAHDLQAALPRSHGRRATAAASAAEDPMTRAKRTHTTPSPSRRSARARLAASHQASPFSQLQRDVESAAMAAAADPGRSSASPAHPTAPAAPHAAKAASLLSQRELRRRADMLKWAERTRAFFHFIDSLPLHVSHSPLKSASMTSSTATPAQPRPSSASLPRRSRSRTIVATPHTAGASETRRSGATAASMSLVRRSNSALASAPVAQHGSSAFEAAVSRVKREAAAASMQQHRQRRSTTAVSHTPAE